MNTPCRYEVYKKVGMERKWEGGRERKGEGGMGREWEGEMGRKGGWNTGIGTT